MAQFVGPHDASGIFRPCGYPLTIEEDNKGAKDLAGGESGKGVAHLDHHHLFISDEVEAGRVFVEKVGTEDMGADITTKPSRSREHIRRAVVKYNFFLPPFRPSEQT